MALARHDEMQAVPDPFAASALGRGRCRIELAREQERGYAESSGSAKSASTGPRGHSAQMALMPSSIIAPSSVASSAARSTARRNARVLGADHGVVHAHCNHALELVADHLSPARRAARNCRLSRLVHQQRHQRGGSGR